MWFLREAVEVCAVDCDEFKDVWGVVKTSRTSWSAMGRVEPCLARVVSVASLQLGDLALSLTVSQTSNVAPVDATARSHFQPDITNIKATLIRVVKGEVVGTWCPDVNAKKNVTLQSSLLLFASLAFTCAA